MMKTIRVPMPVSLRLDQDTFATSWRTWRTNWAVKLWPCQTVPLCRGLPGATP